MFCPLGSSSRGPKPTASPGECITQILGAMFIAVVVTAAENAIIREIRAARGPQPPARETAE